MIEEEDDDENTNADEGSLILRKRQKVNPSYKSIHSSFDIGSDSGNEMTEPEPRTTHYELATKHQTLTKTPSEPELAKPPPPSLVVIKI